MAMHTVDTLHSTSSFSSLFSHNDEFGSSRARDMPISYQNQQTVLVGIHRALEYGNEQCKAASSCSNRIARTNVSRIALHTMSHNQEPTTERPSRRLLVLCVGGKRLRQPLVASQRCTQFGNFRLAAVSQPQYSAGVQSFVARRFGTRICDAQTMC